MFLILRLTVLTAVLAYISACSVPIPAGDYDELRNYIPFGVSKICENKPARIEKIQESGDYSIWKVSSDVENLDRFALVDIAKPCDIAFSYQIDASIQSEYVNQFPYMTQYILWASEPLRNSIDSQRNFLDSEALQALVLEDRLEKCEHRTHDRFSDECREEVYQWILRRVVTLRFSVLAEDAYYYPRLDIVDGEVYWMGEKLI